jgi:hypothetical protein
MSDPQVPADLSDAVTDDGVFEVVHDGYEAVYDALPAAQRSIGSGVRPPIAGSSLLSSPTSAS